MIADLYKPYREKGSIKNEMENLMQYHFGSPINTGPVAGEWMLPAKIEETDRDLLITADLPGISIADLDVSVDGNILTIRGERKSRPAPGLHCLGEKDYGSFHYSIRLAVEVMKDHIQAVFNQNVLTIRLPKTDTHRKVTITGN